MIPYLGTKNIETFKKILRIIIEFYVFNLKPQTHGVKVTVDNLPIL
jgi:hypothetical protein